jgi:hypothetical protein
MHYILLTVVVLSAALAAAASAVVCYCRAARRRVRRRAEWARLAPGLRGLDEELERIWAAGQRGRHR